MRLPGFDLPTGALETLEQLLDPLPYDGSDQQDTLMAAVAAPELELDRSGVDGAEGEDQVADPQPTTNTTEETNSQLVSSGILNPLTPTAPLEPQSIPLQLLVQWSPASTAEQRAAALAHLGGTRVDTIHTAAMQLFGKGVLEVIQLPHGMSLDRAIHLYSARPGVVVAEANAWLGLNATSNDPYYSSGSLWGLYGDRTSPANAYGSQAGEAWAAGAVGSTKAVMGVIDTGIDYAHPDLYLNIWLNQGEIRKLSFFTSLQDTDLDGIISFRDLNQSTNNSYVSDLNNNGRIDAGDLLNDLRWENGVDDDLNGYKDDLIGWDFANSDNDPYDDNSHGTHCSGTIGGMGGNGIGVAGVAWDALIMPLKFLDAIGSGFTSGAIQAVDYCTAATKSWDKNFNAGSVINYIGTSNSWGGGSSSNTLLSSIANGAKLGNFFVAAAGNNSANNDSTAYWPANYSTLSAAGWEAVLAVASITSSGGLSSFSSYGATTVDLGAPGSNIYSTVPGGYGTKNGTSMATPHVAGALTLLAAAYPNATAQQLRQALLAGTTATSSLAGKTVSGGRLDVNNALQQLAAILGGSSSGGTSGGGTTTPTTDPSRTLWGTTGNDNLTGSNGGGSGADQLTGVGDPLSTNPGRAQIDAVSGNGGADLFLLADSRGTFYNDGNNNSQGAGDYLLIKDFNSNEDKLQLRGGNQYLYRNVSATSSSPSYTEIFLSDGNRKFSTADESIARLENVNLAPDTGVYILGSQSWTSYV